jgi:predicted transcriptional regulator
MAKSLNIVIGADIEKLREGFNKAIAIVQKSSNQMSAEVAKSAKSMEERLASIATRNPTMGSVRQLTQLAMEARALGPEFAQVANEIIKQAGRMKDAIADTRGEVTYFASDTRRLDAVLGGIQGVAGAFGVAQGAAAVFGGENKELQATMVKLQGIMALVTGLQAVQNTLQAESAFMVGLTTAATKIQTYVLGQATVAARVYSAALVATGAGAIIAGLVLIYNALQNNAEAAEAAEEAQKKYTDELEAFNNRALKFVERQLEYRKDVAVKQAKLAGKTEAEIAKIELEHMNIRLKTLKKLHDELGDSSELKLQLTQTTQELENDIVLKGLDIQIAAKDKSVTKNIALSKKQLETELQLIKDHGKGVDEAERFRIDRNKKLKEKAAADALKSKQFSGANMIAGTAVAPVLIQVKIDPKSFSQIVQDFDKLMTDVSNAIASMGEDIAVAFGEAIGGAMSGQQDVLANFGDAILTALGGFMSQVGKMLIAYAISIEKLQTAFANPTEALIAGIALVAIGSAIKNSMKKGPSVPAFADGGIVSGPTLGLMGEYPGASSNPEVIAPLDKLKGMLKTNDSSGFVASTSIQGRDLAIVLERYNRDSSRG